MTSKTLLSARDLAVARGGRVLLRDIHFSVQAGEAVHLTGANGSGKTSLLETLAGLRPPTAGEMSIDSDSKPLWVGHRNGMSLALSVEANLETWCGLHRLPTRQIVNALRTMGLVKLRRRAVRTLSAGQRRRTALSTLLLGSAPVWLLDEPLAGLDSSSVPMVGELIAQHLRSGGAVLLTTHQPLPGPTMRELAVTEWVA
jgi:heme exporter protein A